MRRGGRGGMVDRPRVRSYQMIVGLGQLWLTGEGGAELLLADPDGWVEALIELLDGHHPRGAIAQSLRARWRSLTEAEIAGTLATLDAAGFLDEAEHWLYFRSPRRQRY